MRILADVPRYPPWCNAGAEWTVRVILREMARRGHEPVVHVTELTGRHHIDGIPVLGSDLGGATLADLYEQADVVVTHLDSTDGAVDLARRYYRPLVHLVHNHWHLRRHAVEPDDRTLAVLHARWLVGASGWTGRAVVVHPPVFPADYRTAAGERVTLVNLCEAKGGPILFDLARRCPDRAFLGVRGGYAGQFVPDPPPPNVDIVPNTPDVVGNVYRRTRVLLVPSAYETWGRVAVEAACSGIPVIAHPTPGLVEALGDAGIFCDRDAPRQWVAALDRLDDEAEWRRWSARLERRANELDPTAQLDALEAELRRLATVVPQSTGSASR